MSWTTPAAGVPIDVMCREIALGIYERGGHFENVPTIDAGGGLQSWELYGHPWDGWQSQIQGMIDGTLIKRPNIYIWQGSRFRWLNHELGPLNESETDFVYFDLETFADVAGLHYPGLWRRKQNVDDAFSYGLMQRGDIIGSWIFEDLQAGLSALKWVKLDGYYELHGDPAKSGYSTISQAAAEAQFDADEWGGSGGDYTIEAWTQHVSNWRLFRRMTTFYPGRYWSACFFNSGNGVCDSYFKGDAAAKGTFDANGDAGIVEGTDDTILRLAKTNNYPADLIEGEYGSFFPVTNVGRPTWPVSGTERGYILPVKGDGDCVLTVQHVYKPVFSNS